MILTIGLLLVIISGCHKEIPVPVILSVGDCEHGIVSEKNIKEVKQVWVDAQLTDVLISGGCYQDTFIRKRKP